MAHECDTIQNIQGVRAHDTRETGEQGAGVRSDLALICYAGVDALANNYPDPSTGTPS